MVRALKVCFCIHFLDKDTEAQKTQDICPRSSRLEDYDLSPGFGGVQSYVHDRLCNITYMYLLKTHRLVVVLSIYPQTSIISIIGELVRNAHFCALPQTQWLRNCGNQTQGVLWMIQMDAKVCEPLPCSLYAKHSNLKRKKKKNRFPDLREFRVWQRRQAYKSNPSPISLVHWKCSEETWIEIRKVKTSTAKLDGAGKASWERWGMAWILKPEKSLATGTRGESLPGKGRA